MNTLHGKGDFADVIKVANFKTGALVWIFQVNQNYSYKFLKAENFLSLVSEKCEVWEGHDPLLLRVERRRHQESRKRKACEGIQTDSGSKHWPLADSQQRKGGLCPTAARNWTHLWARMSLEMDPSPGRNTAHLTSWYQPCEILSKEPSWVTLYPGFLTHKTVR